MTNELTIEVIIYISDFTERWVAADHHLADQHSELSASEHVPAAFSEPMFCG